MTTEAKWVLSRTAKITESKVTLTAFGASERRVFDGDSAGLAGAVLSELRVPRTRGALLTALAATFEGVVERAELIDELLAHFRATGTVVEAVAPPPQLRPLAGARVVLGATGAVATAMTPVLAGALQAAGAEVRVALTPSGKKFVAPRALEAITHHPVVASLWQGGVPHIELAVWADVVLIAPCTATTLGKLVQGDCSNAVTATAIATKAPVILAPSMNPAMAEAPAVRRNLAQLRADGFHLAWPTWGHEVAEAPGQRRPVLGPMLPADDLVAIVSALTPPRAVTPRPEAAFWDALYARPAGALPWHSDVLEADLAEALKAGKGKLLDLGCGLGTVAIAAAQLGYDVTASDVSPVALAAARQKAGSAAIAFVADDVLDSKLAAGFDVIVDRALLHTLPASAHDRYLRHVTRLLAPQGQLVLKVHSDAEAARRLGTHAFAPDALAALLKPDLTLERCVASTVGGVPALCAVARRA